MPRFIVLSAPMIDNGLSFLASSLLVVLVFASSGGKWAHAVALPNLPHKRTGSLDDVPGIRLIGYYDAKAQTEFPISAVPTRDLTHLVLTNAVSVTSNGTLVYREAAGPAEMSAWPLMKSLLALPRIKLIVSLRGYPDDVALDELAEVDEVRKRFSIEAAKLVGGFKLSGLEIEWHSDDLAGGKAFAAPFDVMEQYHFALLCRDLVSELRIAGGGTLSVAVHPGRQEFADGNFVRGYINWLSVRAYSMRSLGDPHHASLKDMKSALSEWRSKGVPAKQLVLGTPLFARPGVALSSPGDRNDGLNRLWRDIVSAELDRRRRAKDTRRSLRKRPLLSDGALQVGGEADDVADNLHGDRFLDPATGKVWWLSGIATTKSKVQYVLENGFGGLAYRDLQWDSLEPGLSLVHAAKSAELEFHRNKTSRQAADARRRLGLPEAVKGPALFQRGYDVAKTTLSEDDDAGHDEF